MRTDRELLEKYSDIPGLGDDPTLLEVARGLDAAYRSGRLPERLASLSARDIAAHSAPPVPQSGPARRLPTLRRRGAAEAGGGGPQRAGARREAPPSPLRRGIGRAVGATGFAAFAAAVALIVVGLASWLPTVGDGTGPQLASSRRIEPARAVAPASPETDALLDKVYAYSPYTRGIARGDLGSTPNLAQTIDGYTVTVARAYADSKYVFVGLTVDGPEGHHSFRLEDPELQRRSGWRASAILTLAEEPGSALEPALDSGGDADRSGRAQFVGFEAPKLAADRRTLEVHLEIPAVSSRQDVGGDSGAKLPYPDPCDERSEPIRCHVRGPFAFDLSIPVEGTTPRYHDPRISEAVSQTMLKFLDERLSSIRARDRATAREHEGRARLLLTPELGARTTDLRGMDVPNAVDDDGRAKLAALQVWETDAETATRASLPVRWWVDGKLVVRRFHFEREEGSWRISGIEPLRQDPHYWNVLEPEPAP